MKAEYLGTLEEATAVRFLTRRMATLRRRSGVVSPACLPVSPSPPRSDARLCDAGSGLVSLSPSLCGQTLDAVTLAPGSCIPLVSLCLPDAVRALRGRVSRLSVSLCLPVSAVRCCDAGSRVVVVRCEMLRRLRGRVSRFRLSHT